MSIAFDFQTRGNVASATSLTFNHTVSGSNRILFVAIDLSNTGVSISTMTAKKGGSDTAMTLIDNQTATQTNLSLYYMIAPDTGTNAIKINTGGSCNILAISSSYTGVSQSSQPDAHTKAASNTVSLSVVNGGSWVVGASGFAIGTGVTWTAGGGYTLRNSLNDSSGFGAALSDSNASVATGSNTVSFTTSSSTPPVIIAASIRVLPIVNTLTIAVTTYIETVYNVVLTKQKIITAAVATYTVTTYSTVISYLAKKWSNASKSITTWINQNKS